ncbi:MAG: hypothetical protein AB1698_10855 [Pseudomonadota bacterium]
MTEAALGIAAPPTTSRRDLMAGLILLGLANGFAARAATFAADNGWEAALFATFDISAIVWIGSIMVLRRAWQAPDAPLRRGDGPLAVFCIAAFLLPVGQASWVALTVLALHLRATSPPGTPPREAGFLLLMICLPMFWARLLLSAFSGLFLDTDAAVVALLAGTTATQNTVPFADGSGILWIAPACSSVLNLALTLLCAALFAAGSGVAWSWRMTGWTLLACGVVAGINIARLSALVLFPDQYDRLHGPGGGLAFSLLILAVMVGIFSFGTRHERALAA